MSTQGILGNSAQSVSRREFIKRIGAGLLTTTLMGLAPRDVLEAASGTLATWTSSVFTPLIGKSFIVNLGTAGNATWTLTRVTDGVSKIYYKPNRITDVPPGNSFTLVFHAPSKPVLKQGAYPFRNSQLGAFTLFLAPGKADSTGQNYVAVVDHVHT